MTEERMIRFIKPESLDGEVGIRIFFDYYLPNRQLAKDGFNVKNFDDLEPAPPKDWQERLHNVMPPTDWRPICYDSQYNKLNGCDPLIITNSCAICPFLAARHKTKVTQKSGGLDINLDINGQVKE